MTTERPPRLGPDRGGLYRAMSIIAVITGAVTLLWYAGIFATGGLLFIFLQSVYQLRIWLLAVVALVLGAVGLRTRGQRGFAWVAFGIGLTAAILALSVGFLTRFAIIF